MKIDNKAQRLVTETRQRCVFKINQMFYWNCQNNLKMAGTGAAKEKKIIINSPQKLLKPIKGN